MTERAWRRTWSGVHRWIGLCLAILIVPLCLSGAALVGGTALDRVAYPARYAVSGSATLPTSRYFAAAARVSPGERVASVAWPDGRGPVVVAVIGPGPAVRTDVFLDPPSARVLDRASSASGPVRFLRRLHGSLLMPGVGRTIVGLIGVALAVSSATGLWVWWPMTGRRVRGSRRRQHVDDKLHHMAGFWIALPLFVLSVTGVWIAFPALGGSDHRRSPPPLPLGRPSLPVDGVVARARTLIDGQVTAVIWPTTRSADWTVAFGPTRTVKVADDAGTVAAIGHGPGPGGSLIRRIHGGTGMGMIWQAVIAATGLMAALLAVTGVTMWRRGRRRRGEKPT